MKLSRRDFIELTGAGVLALGIAAPGPLAAAETPGASKPTTGAAAAPASKLIGDTHSVDTKYPGPFNVNLEKWFADHPIEAGQMMRMEPMFQTPRIIVLGAINKGALIDLHYHTAADEIVVAVKGQCEQYVDGKWVEMKPGDVHYNPRGVVHATRIVGKDPFYAMSIFTAPPPGGNDRVFLNSDITTAKEGAVVGNWSLLDTQYKKGYVYNMDQWYAAHPVESGKTMRSDPVMGTLRSQLMFAQMPALPVHYHGSADEIIYTYKGTGEIYINGEWTKMDPGVIHFCPRGMIHGIHPAGKEYKIFAVFAPPQANGSDRIFREDLK
ncbi:MAG: cupin domain-containing protein [Desulfomonilaceae bacterium]